MTDQPDSLPLADMVAIELDRRQVKQLFKTDEYTLESGTMNFDRRLNSQEEIQAITCRTDGCSFTCQTFEQFSDHLTQKHLKSDKLEG